MRAVTRLLFNGIVAAEANIIYIVGNYNHRAKSDENNHHTNTALFRSKTRHLRFAQKS